MLTLIASQLHVTQFENHAMTAAAAIQKPSRYFCVVNALFLIVLLLSMPPVWGAAKSQSRNSPVPLTPLWALECWLWEDEVNTAAYVNELLEGYAKYDLPVRTILIDSPWSDRYNDFKVDEKRYPEPEKFFRGLKDRKYRIVLWMTCMVNSQSKDTRVKESQEFYDEARTNGYLLPFSFKTHGG